MNSLVQKHSAVSAAPRYLLPAHVHVCATAESVILLDLKEDKYVGLGPRESTALTTYVEGWPRVLDCNRQSRPLSHAEEYDVQQLISEMMSQNLLTMDATKGQAARHQELAPPALTLDTGNEPAQIGVMKVLLFLRSMSRAAFALRHARLDSVVESVRSRKTKLPPEAVECSDKTIEAVRLFNALRPFSFSARDHCLFDSLALVEYLLACGVASTWVFGVQPAPFAAHSWVQHGCMVLNDTHEHALAYSPILAV